MKETLSDYAEQILSLTSKKDALSSVRINAREFKVIAAPLTQKDPVSPKKRKIVTIAGVTSLMLGMFLAFFMERWEKSNKYDQ